MCDDDDDDDDNINVHKLRLNTIAERRSVSTVTLILSVGWQKWHPACKIPVPSTTNACLLEKVQKAN